MADHVLHPTARRKSPVEDVLHAAENLLSVRITLHDLAGVFVDASGKSLLDPWRGSHRRYETCALDYCKRCLRHCFQVVNRRAAKAGGAFTHRCWKGFVELVVPLRREDVHVATLFAGQWRPRRMRLSPDIGAQTVERIRRLAPTEGKRLVQLGAVLETVGAGLLARADELRGVNRPALSRAEAIRRFL
ncbi:MAG TPA: hypothetical protein DCX07_14060, partial [Phycisphaerales bacterium]|nr:hypothetical protein [Phycisphaerales bacterium]